MIRKDFILQNYRAGGLIHPIAMDVHERIARYHILCEHDMCEETNFVAQQNMEQLGQVQLAFPHGEKRWELTLDCHRH